MFCHFKYLLTIVRSTYSLSVNSGLYSRRKGRQRRAEAAWGGCLQTESSLCGSGSATAQAVDANAPRKPAACHKVQPQPAEVEPPAGVAFRVPAPSRKMGRAFPCAVVDFAARRGQVDDIIPRKDSGMGYTSALITGEVFQHFYFGEENEILNFIITFKW